MFVINDIINITEADGEKRTERIVWIDEGNIICYSIDIKKEKALPVKRKISDLQQFYDEKLPSLVENDPFIFIYNDEEQLSEKNKKLRDERWECIKDMVLREPDIYEAAKRGLLIKKTMNQSGIFERNIYKKAGLRSEALADEVKDLVTLRATEYETAKQREK